MQIEILKDFAGYKKGQKVTIESTKGIPVDIFWRRRLKDAEFDDCVKVIKKTKRGK